ncbi:hypothetical protein [Pseudoxanthomonas winnipegensis]|uniref:Uncharacterized protein n=1 Tax=Pseudoxanthomonas winnipegensis TaxID=2480810 RepID=A0A4Q8M6K8_9GAMM|nr:hypothetical protein [Pseudoxanthomonas winnipegensis]TAA43459.1 hypothetical protein EA655_09325 [Pseudoxanthomonas winnipegensis]
MTDSPGHGTLAVGGDFANVLDGEDYLAMLNSRDEATVVLKAHLILEEFLNIWASKLTGTEDLFAGGFVSFKTKLSIARNLGLAHDLYRALDKYNDIRNKYSHRRKYQADGQIVSSLSGVVDAAVPNLKMVSCSAFEIQSSGLDQNGVRHEMNYAWPDCDNGKKFLIILVVLVLKLTHWMQVAFQERGISYTLITSLPTHERGGS